MRTLLTAETARGRPAQIGYAVQTPRGQHLFIADYLENPEGTEGLLRSRLFARPGSC